MSDTQQAVVAVVADVLDMSEDDLHPDTEFSSLEDWDSMAALELLMQLESQLKVKLDLREFHTVRTVGELAALAKPGK
ncbi:acyl carrier protein [Solihabitans fulvus]|uniref:Acyl carrier protein n=1 Tax=Solihabitans fulvus TaxID=1892852 RepID=A0A5B2X1L8_9PSEU|nr:acyl carrier protein [Solihabitans fulvus]KAA2257091.1 acyl carrier protein [Solihabitans fulvus]